MIVAVQYDNLLRNTGLISAEGDVLSISLNFFGVVVRSENEIQAGEALYQRLS